MNTLKALDYAIKNQRAVSDCLRVIKRKCTPDKYDKVLVILIAQSAKLHIDLIDVSDGIRSINQSTP